MLYSLLIFIGCHFAVQSALVGILVPKVVVAPSSLSPTINAGICLVSSNPPGLSFLWCVRCVNSDIILKRFVAKGTHARR